MARPSLMAQRIGSLIGAALIASCSGNIDEMIAAEQGQPAPGLDPPGRSAPGTPGSQPVPPGAPEPSSPRTSPAACGRGPQPGPSMMRRLTRREYNNTIADLLGDRSNPAETFPPEEHVGGFDNNAGAQIVTGLLAHRYFEAAEEIAARATKDLPKLTQCDPATVGQDACARRFIETFGARAWRRPLRAAEVTQLQGLYAREAARNGFGSGISLVLQALLQSPHFLYRVELGQPARPGESFRRLGSWEMASRLSYFIVGSMPDQELFRAAAADQLVTKEQVLAQARRLMMDPRARQTVAHFHDQWMELDELDAMEKDRKAFPSYTSSLARVFKTETQRFLAGVFWGATPDLATLFTAPFTYVNRTLATFYGIPGTFTDSFQKVELPPGPRAGLLTHAGLLAAHALADDTSPVLRGLFVREQFLCQTPPPPPPDVDVVAPRPDPRLTTRERYARHSVDPACGGCHQFMDPIGLAFENFDGIGQYRATEHGKPIDVSGEVVGSAIGKFVGPGELARKLAGSDEGADCVVTQWFRFAYGRMETEADDCTRLALRQALAAARGDLRELMVLLTQTDAFLYQAL